MVGASGMAGNGTAKNALDIEHEKPNFSALRIFPTLSTMRFPAA